MRSYLLGFVINLQFFTSIPINKEVAMTPKNMERAIRTFPLLGLFQGVFYICLLFSLLYWTNFSSLAISFALWLSMIILTGGIHLDGWMDSSDAFFSYRDKDKRLEIMKDPRTGAFGVISVIVLLAARFLFIYEVILNIKLLSFISIMFIPFFSKILMGLVLAKVPLAKKEGLGYLFQQAFQRTTLWIYPVYIAIAIIVLFLIQRDSIIVLFTMIVATIFLFLYLRKKVLVWFGGVTGDIVGASTEGAECLLWMILWLFH